MCSRCSLEKKRKRLTSKPWHALQRWLESPSAARSVTIPYAEALANLVPPLAVRLRRDFGALLSLIRAHAVLHQATRERDERGRIIATLEDYAVVRELVSDLVSEGIEATVPKSVREAVHAVARLHAQDDAQPVAVIQVAKDLKLDRSAASRRLRSAKDRGFLRDLEDNPRKPSRLVSRGGGRHPPSPRKRVHTPPDGDGDGYRLYGARPMSR